VPVSAQKNMHMLHNSYQVYPLNSVSLFSDGVVPLLLWGGVMQSFFLQYCVCKLGIQQRRLVGGAIVGRAHCYGWNGMNGTESNMWWFPYVLCV
jgi:hypothetical protein